MLLAFAGWVLALALLFREEPADPIAPEPELTATPEKPPPLPPKTSPPPPRKPTPPVQEVDRAKLLALIEARAGALQKCAIGVPLRLLSRITLGLTGEVRSVSFANADAPATVATCVRSEIETWQLPGVKLKREIEVLVGLSIGTDAVAAQQRR